MSIETREERYERRLAHLYSTDQQLADPRPSEAVNAAAANPELRLTAVVKEVLDGYADRPALAARGRVRHRRRRPRSSPTSRSRPTPKA